MKKVPCSNPTCGSRRVHWTRPDEERGTVMIEVPDEHNGKAFCSITCACMAGDFSVRHPTDWYNCAHCEAGYPDQKCTCGAENASE